MHSEHLLTLFIKEVEEELQEVTRCAPSSPRAKKNQKEEKGKKDVKVEEKKGGDEEQEGRSIILIHSCVCSDLWRDDCFSFRSVRCDLPTRLIPLT